MKNIKIISAPSILGLAPCGLENMSESLLSHELAVKLKINTPVIHVPVLNHLYNYQRESETNCINSRAIVEFSRSLSKYITDSIHEKYFSLVLGGDCSILLGIMPALKKYGSYGLIFLDAHADFYEPEKSITGQVADMDLAIVSGRGPEILTNIDNLKPYVADQNIVHIGQRDWEETQKYGSQDLKDTSIKSFGLADIKARGIKNVTADTVDYISKLHLDGFWIHFDTDVISDEINPAVDYRLPGGMELNEITHLVTELSTTTKLMGMSVTIFNPKLDKNGHIAKIIADELENMLESSKF